MYRAPVGRNISNYLTRPSAPLPTKVLIDTKGSLLRSVESSHRAPAACSMLRPSILPETAPILEE